MNLVSSAGQGPRQNLHRVRSVREGERKTLGAERLAGHGRNIHFVDLNNFTSFPTLAVGILVSALRKHGHTVKVLCPLEYGVPSAVRERRENRWQDLERRVHLSTSPPLRKGRDAARGLRSWWRGRPERRVLERVRRALDDKPDLLMMSAYLQHHATVTEIGKLALAAGVPVLLGGPMFNLGQTARAWLDVPGLVAIYGGEADLVLAELVWAISERRSLDGYPGIVTPDGLDTGRRAAAAKPRRGSRSRFHRLSMGSLPDSHRATHGESRLPVEQVPFL